MSTIETQRLFLRMFDLGDLEDLYRLFSEPEAMKYIGNGEVVSRPETEIALISIIKHWERHGFGRWAVCDRETRRLIGYGGLRMLGDTPEVVYHLARSYWGLGLATEMGRASLKYGFNEFGFERIVAITRPENLGSINVMKKIGMKYEKHATYYKIDVVQYSISRENPQAGDLIHYVHSI